MISDNRVPTSVRLELELISYNLFYLDIENNEPKFLKTLAILNASELRIMDTRYELDILENREAFTQFVKRDQTMQVSQIAGRPLEVPLELIDSLVTWSRTYKGATTDLSDRRIVIRAATQNADWNSEPLAALLNYARVIGVVYNNFDSISNWHSRFF